MITSIDKSVYIIEVKKKKRERKEIYTIFLQENVNNVERFFRIPLYVEKQGNKDVNCSAEIGMENFINDTLTVD